jgi:integrase
MRTANYMESTIGMYKRYFKGINDLSTDGIYNVELGLAYASVEINQKGKPYSLGVKVFRKRVIRIFDTYLLTGVVDLALVRNSPAQPMPNSQELIEVLEDYASENKSRGLAVGTCDYYWRLAREYALFLESGKQAKGIGDADAASVLAFMSNITAKWHGTSSYHIASNFRPFLRFLKRDDLVDALKMVGTKRTHNIVSAIADDAEDAVADACCRGLVPARDAAITLLALTTGMRACDIINLRIGDLNWRKMAISTVQQKTHNPLVVPMVAAVAETMARYILDVRPNIDDDHVFLRSIAPYTALRDHASVYEITRRVFASAGIKGVAGSRQLRHNAASKMLRSGTQLTVIAALLGHADPDSSEAYMEADTEHMRACVLPLPKGARA